MHSCRLSIRLCHHTLANGQHCQAPAIRGRTHCRHHLDTQARLRAMARARRQVCIPRLCIPETPADLARNRAEINRVVFSGLIDFPTARMLYWALKLQTGAVNRNYRMALRESRREAANPNKIYYVPATPLFGQPCPQNPAQMIENTDGEKGLNNNQRSRVSPARGYNPRAIGGRSCVDSY